MKAIQRQVGLRCALAFSVVLAMGACKAEEEPLAPQIRPVRTATAQAAGDLRVSVAGVTKTNVDSNLSFRVSGTIDSVPVEVGDRVQRGQLLARLDASDYELDVERARASLAQVEAGLRQANAEYDRARALYENDNASKSDLDAARSAAESGSAQVEAARKALQQAQRQVGYTSLRAPIAGFVAGVTKEINELVSQGESVVRLTSGSSPEVELAVSEVTIPLVRAGMQVAVELPSLAGQKLVGTVSEVGVATTSGTSTYPVTVRLTDDNSSIRPGMAAEVVFEFGARATAPASAVVPQVAVGEDRDGAFVFVVETPSGTENATVRRRAVRIGPARSDGVAIEDGLQVGERVVTAGVRRLSDGMQVRLLGDA